MSLYKIIPEFSWQKSYLSFKKFFLKHIGDLLLQLFKHNLNSGKNKLFVLFLKVIF